MEMKLNKFGVFLLLLQGCVSGVTGECHLSWVTEPLPQGPVLPCCPSLSAGLPCHSLAWLLHPAVEDARAPALLQLQPAPCGRCPGLPAGLQPQVQAHLLLRGAGLQGLQVGHLQGVYYELHWG